MTLYYSHFLTITKRALLLLIVTIIHRASLLPIVTHYYPSWLTITHRDLVFLTTACHRFIHQPQLNKRSWCITACLPPLHSHQYSTQPVYHLSILINTQHSLSTTSPFLPIFNTACLPPLRTHQYSTQHVYHLSVLINTHHHLSTTSPYSSILNTACIPPLHTHQYSTQHVYHLSILINTLNRTRKFLNCDSDLSTCRTF